MPQSSRPNDKQWTRISRTTVDSSSSVAISHASASNSAHQATEFRRLRRRTRDRRHLHHHRRRRRFAAAAEAVQQEPAAVLRRSLQAEAEP